MPKRLANHIKDKIIQPILFTKLQKSENLQCAEMVIQFCQEKNLIGNIKSCRACEHSCHLKEMRKIMPGDAVTPNAGPGLLLDCEVKVQNSYKTPPPTVRMDF